MDGAGYILDTRGHDPFYQHDITSRDVKQLSLQNFNAHNGAGMMSRKIRKPAKALNLAKSHTRKTMFAKLISSIILLSAACCNALVVANVQHNSCDNAFYKRDMLVICEKVTSTRLGEVKQHVEWESHMPAFLLRCRMSILIGFEPQLIHPQLGLPVSKTYTSSDHPDVHTFAGVDAVAKDANGHSVGHRTIHEGTGCQNFSGEATQFDVLQVQAGYSLRVYKRANCQGLYQAYAAPGNYQSVGRLSWSVV
ncbi:hypothetical protein L218DRAFT_946779 [Marasmius fiardii PR-910]|nr:hypothetical protein L218DRAFT_946779 [Marasmius fiardii PR-910]